MIGPRNAAMTAALLAVRIKVTNFYGLAVTFLPLNWHIDVVHIFISLPNAELCRPAFWVGTSVGLYCF